MSVSIYSYYLRTMELTKIGFIGAGNMAQAVVKGLQSSGNMRRRCTFIHVLLVQNENSTWQLQLRRKHHYRIKKCRLEIRGYGRNSLLFTVSRSQYARKERRAVPVSRDSDSSEAILGCQSNGRHQGTPQVASRDSIISSWCKIGQLN